MTALSPIMKDVDAVLQTLDRTSAPVSNVAQDLSKLAESMEKALTVYKVVDEDPVAAGWPEELLEDIRDLRRLEWSLSFSLRVLAYQADQPGSMQSDQEVAERVKSNLILLKKCGRREQFLLLRAFWIDVGDEG
jgi:hypothetical protein